MEELAENKTNYKLFWSGEEVSTDFLACYYANELDDIKEKNGLLGTFSADGKYTFSAETKKGLIALKKKIEDRNEKSYFVVAKTPKSVFSFKLKIFEVEDSSLLAANLYLIEVIDDKRIEKPLKTFVAQYVDKKNDEFLNKVKYIFNITIDDDFLEHEKISNEEIIKPLLPKLTKIDEAELEKIDETFVENMLKQLENCGDIGKKIIAAFLLETQYDKKKEAKEVIKYSVLKKQLEGIIEKEKGLVSLVEINPEIGNVIKAYNTAKSEAVKKASLIEVAPPPPPVEIENLDKKEEKKADKAGASKAKSAGGGKSKSSGSAQKKDSKKKADKKKDDKKKDNKKKADPPYKGAVAPKITEVKLSKPNEQKKAQPILKDKNNISKIADRQLDPKAKPNVKLKTSKVPNVKPQQREEQQFDDETSFFKLGGVRLNVINDDVPLTNQSNKFQDRVEASAEPLMPQVQIPQEDKTKDMFKFSYTEVKITEIDERTL